MKLRNYAASRPPGSSYIRLRISMSSSLLRGDLAIESTHVTLGKCPHMGVYVDKPIGHLLLLPRIGPDESKLAGDRRRDVRLRQKSIGADGVEPHQDGHQGNEPGLQPA
jgi:hypothetical protein